MNETELYRQWLREEDAARMQGWDFSHLRGRYEEEQDLPWDYEQAVRTFLRPDKEILDMDTGGGEFLLSLGHPCNKTSATEGWPPNADLCRHRLVPLGIRFQQADGGGPLPFADGAFDLILNRHGSYDPAEVCRLLRPGGIFITEQVGAQNDRELVELLLGEQPLPFPRQTLACAAEEAQSAGLRVVRGEEAFRPIRFWDVGALVWFARVLPWEFPGFSVDACRERLCRAQEILDRNGVIEGTIHRYLLVAQKDK